MNMLSPLVVLSSNIHNSYVLVLSRSEGAAGMLSTRNYNLTSDAIFFRSKQRGGDIYRLCLFIWSDVLRKLGMSSPQRDISMGKFLVFAYLEG